ncbi:hypothetical protein RB195_026048 [Necator americanus]|uniref:RhoGEF domain protein n=2 Tax=Necator americanus TaxID=51031 RepID=A0ABR1EV82_NECAM
MDGAPSSCYCSMVASSSSDVTASYPKPNTSSAVSPPHVSDDFIEAPVFFYDMDCDLKDLNTALKGAEFLQDSGYQSVLERSAHPFAASIVDDILSEGSDAANDEDWDGFLTVGEDRVRIKDMSDILASRYAFLTGARTNEGMSIVTFPDSRAVLSFEDYQTLITYLLQVPPLEDSHKGFVVIVDRRNDKWSSVRTLFLQITSFFPGTIRVVFLLKPEGVLQRALEVGYRAIAENCSFKVITCDSSVELRRFLRAEQLTMDVGGLIKYNHLEWVQHRMDIERMKSSASAIAQSLSDFGRVLRETELPNDVETTARILQIQTAERDAIKEDFRISVRKGLSLLRAVRQIESKPKHELLSPTRLHNVTAIERMLVQLEETERSFDAFWSKHEKRLMNCFQLRQFEENFRKLQSSFARHMLYLEEHRAVGEGVQAAQLLAEKHEQYTETAQEDVKAAKLLKETGEELISTNDVGISGSLLPKCDELERMAEALNGALQRRATVLRMSITMHTQISQANSWCKKGVDMLSSILQDATPASASSSLAKMDEFLEEGSKLQLDAISQSPSMNSLILLTTTETSTLLAQVAERIDDIRRMGVARRDALAKMVERKPVQVVTPEKTQTPVEERDIGNVRDLQCCSNSESSLGSPQSPHSISIESFVVAELLSTERTYVAELESLVEYYVEPFHAPEYQQGIAVPIRGRSDLVFGNLRELLHFHSRFLLPELLSNENSSAGICRVFVQHANRFLSLYHAYCQNKAASDAIRKEFCEMSSFFADCQRRAGHPLPLGAYLLKPVQRITKYQLLLRELERHCRPEVRPEVAAALSTMLELLAQINAAIHQLHISGFNGDLRLLGPLRLQSECDVYQFSRKKKGKTARAQRRHLFLFDGGVLFCKKRNPPSQPSSLDPEYYEHKMCIPMSSLGFSECSRSGGSRFELWDEAKSDAYAVETCDGEQRSRWIHRLSRVVPREDQLIRQRPKSWTSTISNDSTCSSSTRSSDSEVPVDTNGNSKTTTIFAPSLSSPTDNIGAEVDVAVTSIAPIPESHSAEELVDSC